MKSLKGYYDAFLECADNDPEKIKMGFEVINNYMKNESPAVYHGEYVRTAFVPKMFRKCDFDVLSSDIKLLYGIFEKIINRYFEDEAYRKLFGLTELEEKLILSGRRDIAMLPMLRVDIFYNEETGDYKFCEFNTDGTSAMNEDRELHIAQERSEANGKFTEKYHAVKFELFDSWVKTVCDIYSKAKKTDEKPYVAIVDYLDLGLVHEFKVFEQHFLDAGCGCEVCDVRKLNYDGKNLTGPNGKNIDVIYRRAVTSDIMDKLDESDALLKAKEDGNVILLGDFHTQIIHNKEIFRMLHRQETFEFLNDKEIEYLKKHVPLTKQFNDSDRKTVASDRQGWILKPVDSYGSKGIYAGVEYSDEEWPEAVKKIPSEGYIMQEFCMPYKTENFGEGNNGTGFNEYYNLTGIYVYNGEAAGVYSRVSLTPIISTQYSEKTLPTLLVKE